VKEKQELERKMKEIQLQNQELELKNRFLRSDNDKLQSENKQLHSKLAKLSNGLLYLRRTLFGRSSERYIKEDPNQLSLDFSGQVQLEEEKICLNGVSRRNEDGRRQGTCVKKQPLGKPLPEHLEHRREIIEPNPLPEGAKCIGQEVSEILEYIPVHLYVREIVRRKYALKDGEGIVMGELPSLPFHRSNAGGSLPASLLISKYRDHLPFYRQIEMLKRNGVHLAASTVNDWCASPINLLEPLYERLKKEVLSSDYIQVDESTIPLLDKDKPGAARKGYHWAVRSPEVHQLFFIMIKVPGLNMQQSIY
jgi:transposase